MHLAVNSPSGICMMDGLSLDCPTLILAFPRAPPFAFSRIAVTGVMAEARVNSSPLKLDLPVELTNVVCP